MEEIDTKSRPEPRSEKSPRNGGLRELRDGRMPADFQHIHSPRKTRCPGQPPVLPGLLLFLDFERIHARFQVVKAGTDFHRYTRYVGGGGFKILCSIVTSFYSGINISACF